MKGFLILLIILYLSFFNVALAANPLDVIINEVAWMGTDVSANDEWIELYNNTENSINLDGWQLVAQDGTPKINFSGTIPANGFYLLERTDDTTVPNIPADQIYSGALGNASETLELYDNFDNLMDKVDNSAGWSAGDNSTKQTMERKTDGNWQTSQNPEGTPKAKNSVFAETETVEVEIVDVKPQQPIVYPTDVVINEILPSPEGPDEEEEWIEIFNQNNFEVELSNWQITDTNGKTTTLTFPAGTKIAPNGFLVLPRPTTKITLNNDADGLNLIQPDGKIIDSATYEKAPRGQSYNRTETGWAWSNVLTPGSANIIPALALEIEEVKPAEDKTEQKEGLKETRKIINKEKKLAMVSQLIVEGNSESALTFLIGLFLAVLSGIIILTIKKRAKKVYNKTL